MADARRHRPPRHAVYILVFVSLMVLTVVTVAVSYLHLPVTAAIAVALVVATVKGSLVAGYFMHLSPSEADLLGAGLHRRLLLLRAAAAALDASRADHG